MRSRSAVVIGALVVVAPLTSNSCRRTSLFAQQGDSTSFYKALELETSGKYKEAAPLFRAALRSSASVSALLGLERVYAELGWLDSLTAPLDTLIAADPKEGVYRTVQLRTLQSLGREADL